MAVSLGITCAIVLIILSYKPITDLFFISMDNDIVILQKHVYSLFLHP